MPNQQLKDFHNKTVAITFHDGESATARLTCMDDDCNNVLVDILSTNCPDRYHEPNACSYTVPCSEIVSVAEVSPDGAPVPDSVFAAELPAAA